MEETKLDIEKSNMKDLAMVLNSNAKLEDYRRSCFCLPLRGSLLAYGYFKLAFMFIFGVLTMDFVSLSLVWDSHRSMIQFALILIYLGVELVYTNAFIIGVHLQRLRLLQVYMYFLSIDLLVMAVLIFDFLMLPLVDILEHREIHIFHVMMGFLCAAFIYFALNIYVYVLVRSEVCRLRGDISYESMIDDAVITGVTPPNSQNYFLVTKLNPSSASDHPRFLVKKVGKVGVTTTDVKLTSQQSLSSITGCPLLDVKLSS